jgi:hypothetical protein
VLRPPSRYADRRQLVLSAGCLLALRRSLSGGWIGRKLCAERDNR